MRINRRTLATSIASIPLLNATAAIAQPTTPASSDTVMADASSRITTLGRYLPGGTLDETLDLIWVDPERQVFHIARDIEGEERVSAFVQSQFGNVPPFFMQIRNIEAEMGFGELNIRHAVSSGILPNSIQLLELDLDAAPLLESWSDFGYEERENEYGSFWTIGEDGEFDFSHPIQELVLAQFNNIAILDERTLAFAPMATELARVMATVPEKIPSILDVLAPVTDALPETAISAWYLDGNILQFSSQEGSGEAQAVRLEDQLTLSNDTVGLMPPIRTISVGTTQGAARAPEFHDDTSTTFAILEVERDVETAAEVIAWRHENMASVVTAQPYSDILGEIEIEVVGDYVLRVSSHYAAPRAVFTQMMLQGDGLLFNYRPES